MVHESLAELVAAAAREMQDEQDPGATMDKAVELGLSIVGGAQEAGISLMYRGGRIDTPAATSDAVRRIDEMQYHFNEGPCLDAIRKHGLSLSDDVRSDGQWPTWGPAAADETGLRSMMCFRLFTHGDKFGAINFYSRQTAAFDEDDRDHGVAIAAHMAIAIAAAQQIGQLQAGIDTRTVIGQATGILMARFDMDADQAFAVLTRLSSHTNRKLRDVAHELVETRRLPEGTAR